MAPPRIPYRELARRQMFETQERQERAANRLTPLGRLASQRADPMETRLGPREAVVENTDFEVVETYDYPEPFPLQGTARINVPDQTVNPRGVVVDFESTPNVSRRAVTRPSGYWKLRNGHFIKISEMDDSHLTNCILMCERNAQNRGRRLSTNSPGVYQELCEERSRREVRIIFQSTLSNNGRLLYNSMTGGSEALNARRREMFLAERRREEQERRIVQETQRRIAQEVQRSQDYSSVWGYPSVSMFGQPTPMTPPPTAPEPVPSAVPENLPKRRIKSK